MLVNILCLNAIKKYINDILVVVIVQEGSFIHINLAGNSYPLTSSAQIIVLEKKKIVAGVVLLE